MQQRTDTELSQEDIGSIQPNDKKKHSKQKFNFHLQAELMLSQTELGKLCTGMQCTKRNVIQN